VLHEGYPFAYLRGESHLVVVNPRRDPAALSTGELFGVAPLLASGISVVGDTLSAEGFAYGIFALPGHV
jgi:predicted RecA/RadA family phage recombinase